MNAAITSVYSVIAVCTPWIVVSRSSTICEIATFITLVSSTITNWAEARMSMGIHLRTEDGPYVGGQRRASSGFWAKLPSTDTADDDIDVVRLSDKRLGPPGERGAAGIIAVNQAGSAPEMSFPFGPHDRALRNLAV